MDKAHVEPSTPALKSLHPRASRKQTHQNPRNAMVSTYVTKSKGHGAKRLGSDEGGEGKSWIGFYKEVRRGCTKTWGPTRWKVGEQSSYLQKNPLMGKSRWQQTVVQKLVLLYFRYQVIHKGPGLNSLDDSNGRQRTFKKKSSMGNLGSLGDVHQESTGTLGLFSVSPLLPGHDMSDPVGSHMPAIT